MSAYSLKYIQERQAVKGEEKKMGWFFPEVKGGEERFRVTRDGVRIAANLFKSKRKKVSRLILVCPGFAKEKDGYPISELCWYLTRYGDVLSVDFRGVGNSEGRYSFGAKEYLDLEPYLKWGRKNYRKNILLGLSLGSYHSLRAACTWPNLVDRMLLV